MLKRRQIAKIAREYGFKFEACGYNPPAYGDKEYFASLFWCKDYDRREDDMFEDEEHLREYLQHLKEDRRTRRLNDMLPDPIKPMVLEFDVYGNLLDQCK